MQKILRDYRKNSGHCKNKAKVLKATEKMSRKLQKDGNKLQGEIFFFLRKERKNCRKC